MSQRGWFFCLINDGIILKDYFTYGDWPVDQSGRDKRKYSFGMHGWWVILFCGLCYYLDAGTVNDGMNVTIPAFVQAKGWDYATLLSYSTIAGLVGIVVAFAAARLIVKKGAKFVLVLASMISGLAFIAYGYSQSMVMYLISVSIGSAFANVYSIQATGPIIVNWFPRKRGIVMGIASAFMPIASSTYLHLLTWLINTFGLEMGIAITGGLTIIIGIVCALTIRNTPEERNVAPDNMPITQEELEELKAEQDYKSPWTVKKLVREKTVWLISISYGLLILATNGVISQFVPRLTADKGVSQQEALLMFSAASVCGIVFSVIWGWLDQRIGTKPASLIMILWFIVSLVINLIPGSRMLLWISIVMIGGDLGGTFTFLVSMTTRVFGRKDFSAAYGLISPLFNLIGTLAFVFIAAFVTILPDLFGQMYGGTYAGLIVVCIISFVLVALIDHNRYLGQDHSALNS